MQELVTTATPILEGTLLAVLLPAMSAIAVVGEVLVIASSWLCERLRISLERDDLDADEILSFDPMQPLVKEISIHFPIRWQGHKISQRLSVRYVTSQSGGSID